MGNFITELGAAHIVARHHGIDVRDAIVKPTREEMRDIFAIIIKTPDGLSMEQLLQKSGKGKEQLMKTLMELLQNGDIYEPRKNVFKRI